MTEEMERHASFCTSILGKVSVLDGCLHPKHSQQYTSVRIYATGTKIKYSSSMSLVGRLACCPTRHLRRACGPPRRCQRLAAFSCEFLTPALPSAKKKKIVRKNFTREGQETNVTTMNNTCLRVYVHNSCRCRCRCSCSGITSPRNDGNTMHTVSRSRVVATEGTPIIRSRNFRRQAVARAMS